MQTVGWSQLPNSLATNLNLVQRFPKVLSYLMGSYYLFCISVYCKLSGAVLRSISLWQDSKSKTDLPEDSEHPEDSWCVCSPAAAVQRSAVEVVEAFLATLGKMCCHVFHKQIHVCSVAASRSFGIIGEVRVCSNFGWFTMVDSRED